MRPCWGVLAVLAACSGDAEDGGCPGGVAPPLSSCVAGELFADCGGTGAPRLACSTADARCSWFTSACVAEDYRASSCPADDVCCEANDWPFPGVDFHYELWARLYAFGRGPWDRTREMNVTVAEDPGLPEVTRAFRCEGVDAFGGASPCAAGATPQLFRLREGAIVAFELSTGLVSFGGWSPFVEIDSAAGRARVCISRYTDARPIGCPAGSAVCAGSGTITVDALGAVTRGHVDVEIGTLRLIADF